MTSNGAILVVDDSHDSLALLTEVLTSEGYEVRPADSGELALASVAAKPPELILLDIRMPGMDGFEVFRRLREREESRHIPIIFITVVTEMGQRVEGLKLGAMDFISKPFEREELLARVHTHVELFRLRARLEDHAAELRLVNEQLRSEIAQRNRAEESLRVSEERHRSLIEHLPQRIFIKDRNSVYLSCNANYAADLGISQEKIVGKDDFAFHPPELARAYRSDDQACMASDMVKDLDEPYQLAGQERWAHTVKVPYRDGKGRIIGVLGIFEDITERKQAEQALRQSEERLELALKGADLGLWDLDLTTGQGIVNRRMVEIIGYSPGELETSLDVWREFIHPDDTGSVREHLNEHFEGLTDFVDHEYRIRTKLGHYVWVLARGRVVDRGHEGRPLRMAGTVMDVTDRKGAEQEKENLRAQLLQSQKMETMGTLAAGIAHDFNNMLTVILGYSSFLLTDKNEGDPGYKGLQIIVKTSQDAADLVQRIRIFGRKAEMNLVPLDLNRQIHEVTKLLSHTLPKMIEMVIHLAKDPVIIKADSSQIAQMVMNLAVNANEAMPQGGRLSILTENIVLDDDYCRLLMGVKPGLHVMLTVSDTGRGIDKGLMERIFDPFFTTKGRDYRKGTGLGLSVVQGIVQQHGGHITVESEVGRGTTFRMYFPAVELEKVPEYVEKEIPYPAGGNETILLVEDMDLVRELGATILETFGYTVVSAGDGEEALNVYEKEHRNISLVILDIIMPRMDGKHCLEQLLRINPNVKVIISSGVGQYDLINDIVEIGAKGAVHKPYGMRQLLAMVREVLDGD